MARHKFGEPYDPKLRETEHGSKLYQCWRKIRMSEHYEDWCYFPNFYNWAMQNGYQTGAWLRKTDANKPFEPDNCTWYYPCEESRNIPQSWVDSWNESVNRIRKHYGMPPLEGTDYGN